MGQYYAALVINGHGENKVFSFPAHSKLLEHSWWSNDAVNAVAQDIFQCPKTVYWVGDYSCQTPAEISEELYDIAMNGMFANQNTVNDCSFNLDGKFLVNHSKKLFVDCSDYHKRMSEKSGDWVIHPLPLLTAVGNGRGGGDYYTVNKTMVGTWAGNLLSVEIEVPEGYSEVEPTFCLEENDDPCEMAETEPTPAAKQDKVVIFIHDGVVEGVFTSNKNIKVVISDFISDLDDPKQENELWTTCQNTGLKLLAPEMWP